MKFLIDECLSPNLVSVANDRGFEAYHVVYRGWGGFTDRQLLRHLLDEELILVTNNRDDFVDLVSGVELHPGLVVIFGERPEGQSDRVVRSGTRSDIEDDIADQQGC